MSETAVRAPSSVRPLTARTWADVAVLLVLAVLGVLGFEPSFGGYGFLLAGIGGLAVGAATGILTSVFRVGAIFTAVIAIVAYFLFGTAFAVPDLGLFAVLPTLHSLASIAIGSVYGWADIVTLRAPVGAPQYIAVVPYIATWLVALVSTTLATRWLTSTRARAPRAAWRFGLTLIGPIALYLAGVLVGTDEPFQAGIRGSVFAVLALIWLGWRRRNSAVAAEAAAKRLRNRKLAGTAAVVIGALVIGGGAGFLIAPSNDERFVLRDDIQPPFDPLQYASPLSGFREYTKALEKKTLFTVSGLEKGDVVRLATLDTFTGKLWTVTGPDTQTDGSGSFALVGSKLPAQTFITPSVRKNVSFHIEAYHDVWLPSVGYPTSLDFTGGSASQETDSLRYNDSTGTAVLTTGVISGDDYTMTATVQKVLSADDLAKDSIANVALPPVDASPDIVTSKALDFAGKATTPYAQLDAIRRKFIDSGYLSHGRASDAVPSRAGHGADRVSDLLSRPQMVGDQEQYASAFALMARSLGYPARVVMGFAPTITGSGPVKVTGDDVTAWVEVAFDKVGWVAFSPTPKATDVPQDETPKPQSEPQPQVRQPPRATTTDDQLLTPVSIDNSKSKDKAAPFVIPGWLIGLGLSILIPLAIIFGPILVISLAKSRRRRSRQFGPRGDLQVAGAWDELVDGFTELGYRVPAKSTRVTVAKDLESQLPQGATVRLRPLAVMTDEAVFSGREVDQTSSDRVWTEALAAVEVARGATTRARRLISRYRLLRSGTPKRAPKQPRTKRSAK